LDPVDLELELLLADELFFTGVLDFEEEPADLGGGLF